MKLTEQEQRMLAVVHRRKQLLESLHCIDAAHIDSRPSPEQLAILKDVTTRHIYLVAGNQTGKTAIGARIVAWKFMDNHPYWTRPEAWGDERLLIIVAGRFSSQIEEIWETKIMPLLPSGSFKPKVVGGSVVSVKNLDNGNKIVFISHDKAKEAAQKTQMYVAHHFWLDEMPTSYKFIEEAHRRIQARKGQFIATFTPKIKNEEIRKNVDNVDPRLGKKYKLGITANPIYALPVYDELTGELLFKTGIDEIKASIKNMSVEEQNTILYGDWSGGDNHVFNFNEDRNVWELPETYHFGWSHVASFDPAFSGKAGLIILAQDPANEMWYAVKAMYLDGDAPSDLVDAVAKNLGAYNITRRIYDTQATAFMKEAHKQRPKERWHAIEKHSRKKELIGNLQQALVDGWLRFTPDCELLFSEFRTAEWVEGRDDKIKGTQRFHLLDALQYGIDLLPKQSEETIVLGRDAGIMKVFMQQEARKDKVKAISQHLGRRSKRWK